MDFSFMIERWREFFEINWVSDGVWKLLIFVSGSGFSSLMEF